MTRVFGAKDCWIYTREKHILNAFQVTIAYILAVTKVIILKLPLLDILLAMILLGKPVLRFLCKNGKISEDISNLDPSLTLKVSL